MKKWLAFIVFVTLLALCMPALCEPGDPPACPWEHMPYARVLELEQLRVQQTIGGVRGSPYWLFQAYLGHASLPLRLYEVSKPIFPEQMLFKERVRWSKAGSGEKSITLSVQTETEKIELRVSRPALAAFEQAGIEYLIIENSVGTAVAAYTRTELASVCDYFDLTDEETLCLRGENDPVSVISEDGVRRLVSNGN